MKSNYLIHILDDNYINHYVISESIVEALKLLPDTLSKIEATVLCLEEDIKK
jgi:hypothetical protein